MYCKNCNSLLNENDTVCPNCGVDNNKIMDETREIYINDVVNPKKYKKKNIKPVIVTLVLVLAISVVGLYIIKDSIKNKENPTASTTNTTTPYKNAIFKYKDIQFEYTSEKYGTSTNTIFLKSNNNIFISIKEITPEEYYDIVNTNELLDSSLGEAQTKTYAGDNKYSHIFIVNNVNYLLDVNYYTEIDNGDIQLELSRIINSMQIKK